MHDHGIWIVDPGSIDACPCHAGVLARLQSPPGRQDITVRTIRVDQDAVDVDIGEVGVDVDLLEGAASIGGTQEGADLYAHE